MKHAGPDRRRYFRAALSLLVSYTVVSVPQEQKESISKDISGGGMKIPIGEEFAVGTLLRVQFELLNEEEKILLDARVVWVRPTPEDREYPYEAGIEFINIDLAARTKISNCVLYKAELLKGFFR